MKYIVTGCAGFIGSHLAESLVKKECEVVGIDCFTDYYSRTIKETNVSWLRKQPGFSFHEEDLLDVDLDVLTRPDEELVLFHLAAQAGVRSSWGSDFGVYVRNNIEATQRLLEWAKNRKLKKFVYASSSSVYGDAELPMKESGVPMPISPYGVSKLAGEHLCYLYAKSYGVPTVMLRYFTVYGPRQRPDMAFHKFTKAIIDGSEIEVYGDGSQTRDFTFVSDIVEANMLAARSGKDAEAYNIGGGSRITLKEALSILGELTGSPVKVKYTRKEKGDVAHTHADTGKARNDLGYDPSFSLREGLKQEVEWIKGLNRKAKQLNG